MLFAMAGLMTKWSRGKDMAFFNFLWTDEIIEHVAEHGIDQDDYEGVVSNPVSPEPR
jgi:hypothetical protein